jgi:hypothetical protein
MHLVGIYRDDVASNRFNAPYRAPRAMRAAIKQSQTIIVVRMTRGLSIRYR